MIAAGGQVHRHHPDCHPGHQRAGYGHSQSRRSARRRDPFRSRGETQAHPVGIRRLRPCFRPGAIVLGPDASPSAPLRPRHAQPGQIRPSQHPRRSPWHDPNSGDPTSGNAGHQSLRTRRAAPASRPLAFHHRDAPLSGRRLAPARQPGRRLLRTRGPLLHWLDRKEEQILSHVQHVPEPAC